MFRVYLLTALGTEVVYYEGENYELAKMAVADFNSMAFEARLEEVA
jgi:hypothetical protein